MNTMMNETQLWYCDVCDFESKSKHINSKSHKYKQKYGTVTKE